MRFSTLFAAAAIYAGVASACEHAIELQVRACEKSTQPGVDLCKSQDYGCLCPAWQKVASCYDACQDDPNSYSAEQQAKQNCQFAHQLTSTSRTPKGPKTTEKPSGTGSGSGSEATTTPIDTSSPTLETSTSAGATKGVLSSTPNAGVPYAVPAGGALAAVLGLAGLM